MIFAAVERMVAFRYLRSRRQEGFVSVIAVFSVAGIALGVATLIVTLSVMNGFRAELLQRILGFDGEIAIYGAGGPIGDYATLATKASRVPGVVGVRPVIDGQVMISANHHAAGADAHGIAPASLAAQAMIASDLAPEAMTRFAAGEVLLGSRLAAKLGVTTGDSVSLLSPNGQATAFGTVPRVKSYRVGGIFEVGEYEYDGGYVFMPLSAAQLFFNIGDAATSLEVTIPDADEVRAIDAGLFKVLGTDVRIVDWQMRNGAFFGAVETERNVMFIILSLIVVVAAFNIISSMIMLVNDKGHDIAILRTMGATQGMVLRIFILSGASLGILGTLSGFLLGVLLAENLQAIREFLHRLTGVDPFAEAVYHLAQIPERVDPIEVGMVLAIAFGLSFLATLYPSWRAARLDPVEALRYE